MMGKNCCKNPHSYFAKSHIPQWWFANPNVLSSICYSTKLFILISIDSIKSILAYCRHNPHCTLHSLWRTQFVTNKFPLPPHTLYFPANSPIFLFHSLYHHPKVYCVCICSSVYLSVSCYWNINYFSLRFIYLFIWRRRGRGRGRQADFLLSREPHIMAWAEIKSLTLTWLSHPCVPWIHPNAQKSITHIAGAWSLFFFNEWLSFHSLF